MTIKPLVLLPDPILRQRSRPIERVDDALRGLADDMLETMYDAPGIGLAGIQVGEPLRMHHHRRGKVAPGVKTARKAHRKTLRRMTAARKRTPGTRCS